jgi:transcriptional regulator with XRE-family HTH domain
MNFSRTLRNALGMTQQQFAQELGVSLGLIRAYETGTNISEGSLEAMKTLAASRGFADLVMLNGGDFVIAQVVNPEDRLKAVRLRTASVGRDMSFELHQALDEILSRGTPDAIGSIEYILRATVRQLPSEKKKGKK